jgi:hypothetical protein
VADARELALERDVERRGHGSARRRRVAR